MAKAAPWKQELRNNVWELVRIQRVQLKEFQWDLKLPNPEEIKQLARRIESKWFDSPIYVWADNDNYILDGHQRLKALNKLAEANVYLPRDEVPCVLIYASTIEEAKEKVLEYNARYSEFDVEFLTSWAVNLDVETLMNGNKANMLFTDPPYNMWFEGAIGHDGEKSRDANKTAIVNDNLSKEDFDKFLDDRMTNARMFLNGAFYITFYRLWIDIILNACNRNSFERRNMICRYKPNYNLSNSDYKSIYEPIIYWRNGDHNFYWYTVEQDVWQFRKNWEQPQTLVSRKSVMLKVWKTLIQIKKVDKKQWEIYDLDDKSVFISVEWEDGDVREIEKTKINDLHPTMKPVALVERAMTNSTSKWEIVLDLFWWSWTTLIAAEKRKRIAYMMEYEPAYIQTIIKRFAEYTKNRKDIVCLNRDLNLSTIINA